MIGHVEFVKFVRLARFPAKGAVTRADDSFTRAGGGGVVAAVVLAEHGAEVDFYCALGRDDNGEAAAAELEARGVTLHVAWREQPTREVITLLERDGERAIITIGERLEPIAADPLDWKKLGGAAGVFFTAGDTGAARLARETLGSRVLTARAGGPRGRVGEGRRARVQRR